jgi:hypothetical protein
MNPFTIKFTGRSNRYAKGKYLHSLFFSSDADRRLAPLTRGLNCGRNDEAIKKAMTPIHALFMLAVPLNGKC